jgi:hypothetical protein
VRRLQEEAAQRGEEQQDAERRPDKNASQEHATAGGRHPRADRDAGVAEVGELPAGGSAPPGVHDSASGTPPGEDQPSEQPGEEVREP